MDELSPRQREIVATARDLLGREGPEGLTLGRIARALGIRTPSLYKHFASRRHLEAVLIADGLEQLARRLAGRDLPDMAAQYRAFALEQPALYRLMTDRPLPRDLLAPGVEERAAAPILAAAGGDEHRARAAWALAHGLVALELAGRFPPDADLDAAWDRGIQALDAGSG